jgi:hypothetical protein
MVPVTSPLEYSFAGQCSALAATLREQFVWPSPDAGFALYLSSQSAQKIPIDLPTRMSSTPLQTSSQAPELAAFGFYAASQQTSADRVTPQGWAAAFSRLTGRDAFPIDRHAFTFRPIELLGIALGAGLTPFMPASDRRWFRDILNEAPKKCATDLWSSLLISAARLATGLPDGPTFAAPLDALGLEELALLVWLSSANDFQKGAWSTLPKPALQKQFLTRCLQTPPAAQDAARSALLHTAIRISCDSLLDSEVSKNWQLRSSTKDAVSLVEQICRHFHQCALQLLKRHDSRDTLKIKDEYDVQDLLHALLRLHFEDVRPEEWTPSYAGSSNRMDFLLKKELVVVEAKMTRKGLGQKEVAKQLSEDIAWYRKHQDCGALVCFVYDPGHLCSNAAAIESDVPQSSPGFPVTVIVGPQGL